jgi:hypothetical protein
MTTGIDYPDPEDSTSLASWNPEGNNQDHIDAWTRAEELIRSPQFHGGVVRYYPFTKCDKGRPDSNVTKKATYFHPQYAVLFGRRFRTRVDRQSFTLRPEEAIVATKDRLDLDTANLDLVKSWIKFCRLNHTKCGHKPKTHMSLKVIDCISRRICAAVPGQAYVALSYVWGQDFKDGQAATANSGLYHPNTIEDAIRVAITVGIPYLWVDRYCIDQDNEAERHLNITNMDKIYAGAELTIIASSGSNPNHGLPGVSKPRPEASVTILSHGVLDCFKSPFRSIRECLWHKRGWTFQEMLLSRRRLVFTDSQMVFQCLSADYREPYNVGHVDADFDFPSSSSIPGIEGRHGPIWTFAEGWYDQLFPEGGVGKTASDIYTRIEEYSQRQLSYPKDRLDAIEGIFTAFQDRIHGYAHHFWGIPILHDCESIDEKDMILSFCYGLLWVSSETPRSRGELWPSWSWPHAEGHVHWIEDNPRSWYAEGLGIKLITHEGDRENLVQFALQRHSYKQYRPCIELTTWVESSKHVSLKGSEGSLKKINETEHAIVYVGIYPRFDSPRFLEYEIDCLVVEDTGDGTFRRMEYARYDMSKQEVCLSSDLHRTSMDGRFEDPPSTRAAMWREELRARGFFDTWELRTILLV